MCPLIWSPEWPFQRFLPLRGWVASKGTLAYCFADDARLLGVLFGGGGWCLV